MGPSSWRGGREGAWGSLGTPRKLAGKEGQAFQPRELRPSQMEFGLQLLPSQPVSVFMAGTVFLSPRTRVSKWDSPSRRSVACVFSSHGVIFEPRLSLGTETRQPSLASWE